MKKQGLIISISLYLFSVAIFLITQLSTVSQAYNDANIISGSYQLRVFLNCVAIICSIVAATIGKVKTGIAILRVLLSFLIICLILALGMQNNAIA